MEIRDARPARALTLSVTAAIAAAFLVSGCDSASPTATSLARCPAAPGVSPSHIATGLLYPVRGLAAQTLGPYRAGVDARLGAANASGGVYGRTVNYQWADDQGQPQQNLAAARSLVTSEVFAIQEFSPAPQGSAQWLNAQGVPVVGTSNNPVWSQYRNMFSYFNFATDNTHSTTTWGKYAKSQGATKAAILVSKASDGSVPAADQLQLSLRSAGISTVTINAEPNILDVPTVVREIRNSGADLITGVLEPADFIKIALTARATLPAIKILSLIGYDPGVFAVGRQLAGMSVAVGYTPFERPIPAHKVFLNAMVQYAPQQQPAANEISLIGWVDADLMLRGLAAAGRCPTRQSFMTNLRAVRDFSADGLLASPVNMKTIFGEPTLCYSFMQIGPQGDRFVPVGDKPLCGDSIGK